MDTVKALRRAGKRTFFVTNNSSKSRRQYCLKLEGFGVHGVGVEDIVTSGSAIAGEEKHGVDFFLLPFFTHSGTDDLTVGRNYYQSSFRERSNSIS